jgi:hypothetical protein
MNIVFKNFLFKANETNAYVYQHSKGNEISFFFKN